MSVSKDYRMAVYSLFRGFLVGSGSYDRFIKNMKFYHGHTSLIELIDVCIHSEGIDCFGERLVDFAFCWSDTPEGTMCWDGVSNFWKKYYNLSKEDLLRAREKINFNSIW